VNNADVTYRDTILSIQGEEFAIVFTHLISEFFTANDPSLDDYDSGETIGSIYCPALYIELKQNYRGGNKVNQANDLTNSTQNPIENWVTDPQSGDPAGQIFNRRALTSGSTDVYIVGWTARRDQYFWYKVINNFACGEFSSNFNLVNDTELIIDKEKNTGAGTQVLFTISEVAGWFDQQDTTGGECGIQGYRLYTKYDGSDEIELVRPANNGTVDERDPEYRFQDRDRTNYLTDSFFFTSNLTADPGIPVIEYWMYIGA